MHLTWRVCELHRVTDYRHGPPGGVVNFYSHLLGLNLRVVKYALYVVDAGTGNPGGIQPLDPRARVSGLPVFLSQRRLMFRAALPDACCSGTGGCS